MIDTREAETFSSTIMTRLSVPISSTSAIPTETWNRDRRSSRDRGSSGVAASANGKKRGPRLAHAEINCWLICFTFTLTR